MQTNWARQLIAGGGDVRAVIVMWRAVQPQKARATAQHAAACAIFVLFPDQAADLMQIADSADAEIFHLRSR